MTAIEPGPGSVLARLARRGPRVRAGERCELCAEPIADGHGHVVDMEVRAMRCVCRPCHLLFTAAGAGRDRHRAVPDRVVALGDALGPQLWDRLEVPVSVAFFLHNSALGHVVGLYPGPAGATESELSLAAWNELLAAAPALAAMEPDVEALLLRDAGSGAHEAFIVPVDRCYELAGRLRSVWQGVNGGAAARETLGQFFAELAACARPVEATP